MGWTQHAAVRAIHMRFLMLIVNDQIANVGNPGEGVSENKNRVMLIEQRVSQQQQRADQAQPPECRGHYHPFELFRRIPLNEKPAEEDHVSHPANDLPPVPIDAEQLALMPEQVLPPM